MKKEKAMELQKIADLVTVNVRHSFTDEELLQQSSLLAKTVKDCETEEANKKSDMSVYKNKIDSLKAEIKNISGKINNGYTFLDKPAELFLDYNTNERVYLAKENGDLLKKEAFHASDFQKKIDFTGISAETQEQIDENNDYAPDENGMYLDNDGNLTDLRPLQALQVTNPDVLDKVIADKKKSAREPKMKPVPKDNLGPHYNKSAEFQDDDDENYNHPVID